MGPPLVGGLLGHRGEHLGCFGQTQVPEVVFDGLVDPAWMGGGGHAPNPLQPQPRS